jgi:hypothetical protein
MNGWDLFTYMMVVLLAGGAIVIFGFFLKDVGGVLKGQVGDGDEKQKQKKS